MCQTLNLTIRPDGTATVAPTDCYDGGRHCRSLSAPYIAALGVQVGDVDLTVSHVSSLDLIVKDLEALEVAAKACGLEFRENQRSWRWFGRWMRDYHAPDAAFNHGVAPADYGRCSHALSIPDNPAAYEVGVIACPGGYRLAWDHYDRELMRHIARSGKGALADKLVQGYAAEVARKAAAKLGHRHLDETTLEDGSLRIRYEVPATL